MRHKVLSLDYRDRYDGTDRLANYAAYQAYQEYMSKSTADTDKKKQRMKRLLHIGIENELTQRQKDCMTYYFYEGKSVNEIAEIIDIKPTTVYKHIKKAKEALKKCMLYL